MIFAAELAHGPSEGILGRMKDHSEWENGSPTRTSR